MRYLLLVLFLTGCGRHSATNYHCNSEQSATLEKFVNECSKDFGQNKQSCWQTMVKNICTYRE